MTSHIAESTLERGHLFGMDLAMHSPETQPKSGDELGGRLGMLAAAICPSACELPAADCGSPARRPERCFRPVVRPVFPRSTDSDHLGLSWVDANWPGLPMPARRTFAPGILPSALSKETSLRRPGSARLPTPLDWHGRPLRPTEFQEGPRTLCARGARFRR
jgi:hypothetical protein